MEHVLAILLAALTFQTAPAPAQMNPPPTEVRKLLEERWKGWQQAGPLLQADFDGDGQPDVALLVRTPQATRLVVALARPDEDRVIDVDGYMDGTVSVEPRGAKYRLKGYPLDDYFSSATLVIRQPNGARTAYVWDGLTFSKVALG
jgi:hypothetical protein